MRTVSGEELIDSMTITEKIADQAIEARKELGQGGDGKTFLMKIAQLQKACNPVIVLIAETSPPRELQQFAMTLALGIKGTELGLWYYLYGTMAGNQDYILHGDGLIEEGYGKLKMASAMIQQKQ